MSHPLDRPVWHALAGRQRALAIGDARALRFRPDIGCFAAAADDGGDSLSALAGLLPDDGTLYLIEREQFPPIPGGMVVRQAPCVQMVAEGGADGADDPAAIELGDDDAGEMLALATLTEPGPFFARTHRLGGFIGIREEGRLVAMAGERMKPPGFTEVSGVCTHPDHRGRGHARALMALVARRIRARGETPFLHAYASNSGAIALYETLGFRLRGTMTMSAIGRATDQDLPGRGRS